MVKLKQIQWHITMILDLWGRKSGGRNDEAWMEQCAALLKDADKGNHRNKGRDKRKHNKCKKRLAKSLIQIHLVHTLSRAPYLLPFGTPLGSFLSTIIQKQHWEATPNVVSHLYEAFEIPNPFLQNKNEGDVTYGFGFLSIASGAVAPLLDSNMDTEESNTATMEPSPEAAKKAPKKRQRDKNPVADKQQKKQRVLTTLKQNRFKTTTNRTTHFHSKIKDISKLLDKRATFASPSLQDRRMKRSNETRATSNEKSKKSKHVPIITPHNTKEPPSTAVQPTINKRSLIPNVSGGKHVTIRESNKDNLMSPPANRKVTVASTPPTKGDRGHSLEAHTGNDAGVMGAMSTQVKPCSKTLENGVVGETPVLKRGRSMVLETPTDCSLLHTNMENDLNDGVAIHNLLPTANTSKAPAAVQPVKLFGAIRPNKNKPLAAGAKKSSSVTDKKKSRGIKSIQMARALLRRKSI
jgi:hypothetical protein